MCYQEEVLTCRRCQLFGLCVVGADLMGLRGLQASPAGHRAQTTSSMSAMKANVSTVRGFCAGCAPATDHWQGLIKLNSGRSAGAGPELEHQKTQERHKNVTL